jgi:DNA processing protein
MLKQIADPPLVLYVAGQVEALALPAVAVVGTRHPTVYGRETAQRFGYQLAAAGYVVVSGLALGIDTQAHTGALQAKGRTVAVLGGALDCLFPRENTGLAREIALKGGAVVSEYPFGRQPDRQTFRCATASVSGLCKGVVVIEAPLNSGTMITVGQALDQERTVMAVPGRVDSPASLGCHRLCARARVCGDGDDVMEETSGTSAAASARGGRGPGVRRRERSLRRSPRTRARRVGGGSNGRVVHGRSGPLRATGRGKVSAVVVGLRSSG